MGTVHWAEELGYCALCLDDGTDIWNGIKYNGVFYPTFEDQFIKRMNEIKKKGIGKRDDDVWIIGYMKSGTHWLWEIVRMLLTCSFEVDKADGKTSGHLEMTSQEMLERLPCPRILSTHFSPSESWLSDIIGSSKVLVPIRNPKDTSVSLFKHLAAEKYGTNLRCGWDRYINEVWFSKKYMVYDTWADYTDLMWRFCCTESNYYPVVYEQLLRDPVKIVSDLANFLHVTLSEEDIKMICTATMFDNMKAKKMESMKVYDATFEDNYTMFRSGKSGNWKKYFTVEQNELFDLNMQKELARFPKLAEVLDMTQI